MCRRLYKKVCISLREHAANVINFEKKKMLLLTEKELNLHQNSTVYLQKKFIEKLAKDKNYWKARDHCYFTSKYRGAAHKICNLRFNVPNKIAVVFNNGSNYNYQFYFKRISKRV